MSVNPDSPASAGRRLLVRLALHRPELRAWALYDWANSAMVTTIVTAVFPIYFYRVAGADLPGAVAVQRFAVATVVSPAVIALLAPVLGALADRSPLKKRMLAVFMGLGIAAAAGLSFIRHGDWLPALMLFALAEIGAGCSFVFYDSLLPHVARKDEIDRLSTTGYALGYLGGGILLALNLAWIRWPEWFGLPQGTWPARLAFLSAAVWWLVFSIPLLRRVPEPRATGQRGDARARFSISAAFSQPWRTFGELRRYRHALIMLAAFLVYNDGIGTIIKMAAILGTEAGIGQDVILAAIVMVQLVGIPFTVLFGALAGRIGAKWAVFCGLCIYLGIAVMAYSLTTAGDFFRLAFLVAVAQGGTQALSRSLFASLIPRERSAEFFAFFGLTERFAGIAGPAAFAGVMALTGSSRGAIGSVVLFFLVGGLLLLFVNVEAGRRAAGNVQP